MGNAAGPLCRVAAQHYCSLDQQFGLPDTALMLYKDNQESRPVHTSAYGNQASCIRLNVLFGVEFSVHFFYNPAVQNFCNPKSGAFFLQTCFAKMAQNFYEIIIFSTHLLWLRDSHKLRGLLVVVLVFP